MPKESKAPTSIGACEEEMATHADGYKAYEAARLERKGLEESDPRYAELTSVMEENRAAFTPYWRAYNARSALRKKRQGNAPKGAKGGKVTGAAKGARPGTATGEGQA